MKLFHSPASPFVRKVLVAARVLGIEDRVELVPAVLSPTSPDAALSTANPLGKIPALVTDEGVALFDSPVICDYLESHRAPDAKPLVPLMEPQRSRVLRLEALADGIVDAGILIRYELVLRPEDKRWPEWIEGQTRKVMQGLAVLEAEAASWGGDLDRGQIAVVCAIDWLEFRKPVGELRQSHPRLYAAHDRLSALPAFRGTGPSA
jgi:glutathione S-transferase